LHNGLEIHQADVPQAFIQSLIDTETYLRTPAGVSFDARHKLVTYGCAEDSAANRDTQHCFEADGEGEIRANLAKFLSLRIGTPTSLVYGGWHGKGRKKAPGPQNTMPETLYWKMIHFFLSHRGPEATHTRARAKFGFGPNKKEPWLLSRGGNSNSQLFPPKRSPTRPPDRPQLGRARRGRGAVTATSADCPRGRPSPPSLAAAATRATK